MGWKGYDDDHLLRDAELERLCDFPKGKMAKLRSRGLSPIYVQIGRAIYYRAKDIEAWINQNLKGSA